LCVVGRIDLVSLHTHTPALRSISISKKRVDAPPSVIRLNHPRPKTKTTQKNNRRQRAGGDGEAAE
jgi:hypothetical protein